MIVALALLASLQQAVPTQETPSFEREIRPILMSRCSGCHQPAMMDGDLDLTTHAAITAGAGSESILNISAVEESPLLESVIGFDGLPPDMPPKGPALSAEEVELLRRWVAAGAPDDSLGTAPPWSATNPPKYPRPPVISSVAHSNDGRWLAVTGMHEVLVYSAANLILEKRLIGLSERITSVCFSPDSARLAVGGGTPAISGELQLWDVNEARLEWARSVTHDTIRGISFSPDGAFIACGGTDNTLRALRASDGEQVLYQSSHEDWVLATEWSTDGSHLLSVGRDRSLKLVKVETQQFIDNVTSITPGALRGGLLAVERHPSEDQVLVGGADGSPQIFKIFRDKKRVIGDNYNLIRAFERLPGRVYGLAWSPEGKSIIAVSSTGTAGFIRHSNAEDGATLWTRELDAGQFTVSMSPDGSHCVCAGADGVLRQYSLTDGALKNSLAVSPSGKEK